MESKNIIVWGRNMAANTLKAAEAAREKGAHVRVRSADHFDGVEDCQLALVDESYEVIINEHEGAGIDVQTFKANAPETEAEADNSDAEQADTQAGGNSDEPSYEFTENTHHMKLKSAASEEARRTIEDKEEAISILRQAGRIAPE